jgi:hypothetical protein
LIPLDELPDFAEGEKSSVFCWYFGFKPGVRSGWSEPQRQNYLAGCTQNFQSILREQMNARFTGQY